MQPATKKLSADERKNLTVQTVIQLAAEGNPSDISTTAIAKRMGVTQGALFRHFPTKDSILEAVINWFSGKILVKIDKAIIGKTSALQALEAIFLAHIKFAAKHPGAPRMLFGELQKPKDTLSKKLISAFLSQYKQRLQKWLVYGIENGELSAELNIQAAAVLFVGCIQGLVTQSLLEDDASLIASNAEDVWQLYKLSLIGNSHV